MSALHRALLLTALCGACGPEPGSRPRPTVRIEPREAEPRFEGFEGSEGSASRIAAAGQAPRARPGDWLLRAAGKVAVVSAEEGRIVALGEDGKSSGLHYIEPVAFEAFDVLPTDPPRIAASGGVLHVVERIQTRPLELHAWLYFAGGLLTVESELVHVGGAPVIAATLGEVVAWGNTPTWVEGHGFLDEGGSHAGLFAARESLGLAYALCSEGGRVVARVSSPGLDGYHRTPRTGEIRTGIDEGARSGRRKIWISISPRSLGDAAMALPCAGETRPMALPRDEAATTLEVARCESEQARRSRLEREASAPPGSKKPEEEPVGVPFARFDVAGRRTVPLPVGGCLRARLAAPGHAPGAWFDPHGSEPPRRGPRAGTLRWEIRDASGAVLPAKLLVRGLGETPDPDWGEDPKRGAAKNFVYALGDGSLPLPPGRYEVRVHHGPEHDAHTQTLSIRHGSEALVRARLEHVVDTSGWISADLHVHAAPSFDAPTLLEERVRSLVAVGLEVAVATDHNAVTDYRPAIERLGVGDALASLVGNEVTTDGTLLGHFNVFPLAPGAPAVRWREVAPAQLFAEARQHLEGPGVIQVNHPRMGDIGYFELLHLDRGAVELWKERAPLAELGFDAIEVFNGDHYAEVDEVREVMKDWYALLEAGHRYAATGNSDSHKVAYHEAGVPRSWVAVVDDAPRELDARTFVAAVRAARVVVSSGPFIRFTAGDASIGDTVAAGTHELRIRVDAPPWIDVSRVELVRRGELVRRFEVRGRARPRFQKSLELELRAGDWLIVVAHGEEPMKHLYRKGAEPFAFTNPIWVK